MDVQGAADPSVDELTARLHSATARTAAARVAMTDAEHDALAVQRNAEVTRLPHLQALRAFVSGRYRAERDAASERVAAADLARIAAKERLQRAEHDEGLAGERLTTASKAASAAHAQAVAAAVAQVLAGAGVEAARMSEHAQLMESCAAELKEVAEAARAVTAARDAAAVADRELGSASSWGTYDTWFGGGLLSSSIKHDRIDSANDAMGRVHAALASARNELADVSMDVAAPDLSAVGKNRTMDVWFDNIFSDLGTQSRIQDGQADVRQLLSALADVDRRLMDLREQLIRQEAAARAARDALIAPLLASRS